MTPTMSCTRMVFVTYLKQTISSPKTTPMLFRFLRKERDRRDVFAASASIPPLLTSRAEDESRLDGLDLEEEWEEEDGDLDSAFDKYRRERLAELELKKKQRERALKTGDVESVDNESLQKILKEHACVSWGQAPPKRLVCQFSVK